MWRQRETYQQLASDEDDDATIDHGRLSIKSSDLVLDLLEGQGLLFTQSAESV
jgi:hypothetical protein